MQEIGKRSPIVRITEIFVWFSFRGEIETAWIVRLYLFWNVYKMCDSVSYPSAIAASVKTQFTVKHWLLFHTAAAGLCSGVLLCYCRLRG